MSISDALPLEASRSRP